MVSTRASVVLFLAVLTQGWPEPALAQGVRLNSVRGRIRLLRSGAKQPYHQLARAFEYQTRSMCGPTSAANVLNALERAGGNRPCHSQLTVLAASGETLEQVRGRGFSLRQLSGVLRRYRDHVNTGFDVKTRVVSPGTSPARIKGELVDALGGQGYVVVNFDRRALGQQGKGHFSPLGAYDARSDSFLMLDVNKQRSWRWIGADALIGAMGRQTDQSRGYVVVSPVQ